LHGRATVNRNAGENGIQAIGREGIKAAFGQRVIGFGHCRQAAQNAMEAGFDGVQIHAANGYLIDQFLRDNSNFRDDEYGGSIENRMRFLRLVTEAIVSAVGTQHTSVRLSPNGNSQGVNDSNPGPLYTAVADMLDEIGIAFLELREPPRDGTLGQSDRDPLAPLIRSHFDAPLVLNSDLDAKKAQALLDSGVADAISFGRLFISNPNLPRRLAMRQPLADYDKQTFYTQGADGYVDYPAAN